MAAIDRLKDLQQTDLLIHRLRQRLNEIPGQIDQLKDSFKRETERLANLEKKVKKESVELKETELEIASLEEEIKKCQRRLMEVKTNREYSALVAEIDGLKKEISKREEEAILLMDSVNLVKKEFKEEEKKVEKEKAALTKKIKELTLEAEKTREALLEEEKRRPVLASAVSREVLTAYERILSVKPDRRALVGVKDGTCQGCHTRLPTITLDQLYKGRDLVFCEGCNRILFLEL